MEIGSIPEPQILILRGDDELAMARSVQQLSARLGDPSLADLNTTRLDGRQNSEEELLTAATTIPFLAERRLVVVDHPLSRLGNDTARARFLELLERLPSTTTLVLVIEDHWKNRKNRQGIWEIVWEILPQTHWLVRWCENSGGKALIQDFRLPQPADMPGWIRQQAREMGGNFQSQAAAALAGHVGNDTRLARMEIEKLLTYVNFQRPIEVADVETLTAPGSQVSIFEMVDALAAGRTSAALRMLHQLSEEQDPAGLFNMIVRQFRLLIQTREVLDEGGNPQDTARLLSQPNFIAEKLVSQARRFRMSELTEIYHQLLEIDLAAKTGQMPLDLALDTFIARITRE